jgi:hypothetical protein
MRPDSNPLAAQALAEHPATLDPGHPVNAALSEAGAGRVPRLLYADHGRRIATLASHSLLAQLELPFGWHAIEDAWHLALFEPGRQVQMQLGLVPRNERDLNAALDDVELEVCGRCPAPGALRLRHGRMHALALRDQAHGGVPQEEYHLLLPGPDAATLLHARVTATPPRSRDAIDLAEALLDSLVFAECGADAACATNETHAGLR